MDQPRRWIQARLDEVCPLITDGTHHSPPNSEIGEYMYVTAKNIKPWGLDIRDITFVDAEHHREIYARCSVKSGDVLYIKDGVTAGLAAVNRLETPFSMLSSVALLRPNTEVLDAEFLKHWLNSPETFSVMTGGMTGSAIRRIILKQIRAAQLSLPPLNEQRRIAAKLDTTLAAVDACRQRLDGVAAIIKRFRQAVLAAATSGELTREWREEKNCEHTWLQTTIDQIAKVGTGSTPLRSNPAFYGNAGIPWITSAATSAEIITSASEFVTEQGQVAGRLRIYPEGTLLVAMYGEGKTRGQVSELGIPATINQACAAIHDAIELHLIPFVKIALKANYLEMRDLAEGGNQPNLNLSKIKKFPIALPSKDEVFEICGRVETLFTLADQLEARLTAARKVVDCLTPALLAKAFRGELVPQDPNDKPASMVLERIRAARQAEASAGKPSRRGRPKAAANPDQLPLDAAPVPPDFLAGLLREYGPLSERALLAVSELEPVWFEHQLCRELERGTAREVQANGQVLLEAAV
jgi:type I restriction enzyme S subunit